MYRILLSGATGAVGSILLPRLIEDGHEVFCIVRGRKGQMPEERIKIKTSGMPGRITILEGDITKPNAGLSNRDISGLAGTIDKIVHCAASTKFDEKYAIEIIKANLGGTKNMLGLAKRIGASEVHYVSTAYVAGDSAVFSDTDCRKGQRLRNPYEESKLAAEELVQLWCRCANIPFSIYRLSVVIGDSVTGFSPSFDGYYGLFKSIIKTKHLLQRKYKNGAGLPSDIKLENDSLHIPLEINCSSTSTINLIPSDWVVNMMSQLISITSTNQIFHIVHPEPPLFKWMIETSLEHLKIKGFYYDPEDSPEEKSGQVMMLQAAMNERLERFRPYLTHEAMFTSRNLEMALGSRYVKPSPITAELLGKLLDYAVSVDWGKERKTSKEELL